MKLKFTVLSIILVIFSIINVYSQSLQRIKKSEFNGNSKERKAAFQKFEKAFDLYDKGEGYINVVIANLKEIYPYNKELDKLNYNLGVCYLIGGPKTNALHCLQLAKKSNPDISEDIHFLLGLAYQYQNEFSKAILQFKMNIELIQQNNYKDKRGLIAISKKHILECQNGKIIPSHESQVKIELLKSVNSLYDEYNPISINSKLFFSSRRGDSNDLRSNKDAKFFERVFVRDSSGITSKIAIRTPQKSNVAFLSMNKDGDVAMYTDAEGLGDVVLVKQKGEKWKELKKLKAINEKLSRETSVCYSADGSEMYFVSNRKGGFGDCDIYFCKKNDNGQWSKAYNVGGDINTEYDECDVFITKDAKKLYFSSNGHNSIGGYDIFCCNRLDDGNWGTPHNLGFPINSTDNDINYFEDEAGRFYFASERSGGKGGFDIYSQTLEEPKAELVKPKVEEPIVNSIEPTKIEALEIPSVPFQSDVPEINEVKLNQELVKEDFTYRVQIAACRKEMSPVDLFKRYKGGDVIEHLYVEGWHKYTIGSFLSYDKAAAYRDSCGVSDAFVVLFKGGYRLGIARKIGGVN